MGKIRLNEARPNYVERPIVDPKEAMERALKQVRAERNRRAHFLITPSARG